jgi:hypothetical protein
VTAPAATTRPVIESVSLSGGVLTILGQNFGDQAGSVRFGRSQFQVMSWSDTAVTVQFPLTGYHGRIRLVVVRPDHALSNVVRMRF